ncbi:MFS transporter [Aneurinibacillus sp. Ricciae_BoGa-3]|uniref:MFS transporter n=1 Tax=Aneurinibacillus sp. Ricciae_BoGa-3 TaxID=3022697 RepID=UPI00234261E2|nr:MFS transporter [Aneurinibacillus sp. Ricciae_BoGa-3]WCK53395.1 MFS transporter [Aneurinibacillus sp. Ricciae_BoGa-3]
MKHHAVLTPSVNMPSLKKKVASPWTVWFVTSLAYLFIVSQRTAPGVISDHLLRDFHTTGSVLGMVSGLQFFMYMILQIPVGLWGDRFGPARFLVFGVICNGAGTLIYSIATSLSFLLIGRVLVGLGDAMIWVNCVLLLSMVFSRDVFAEVLGWTGTMGNLGGILTTMPLAWWVTVSGWRVPFMVMGIILIVHATCMIWIFRKSLASHPMAPAAEDGKTLHVLREILFQKNSWPPFLCHFGIVGTYAGFISLWAVPFLLDTYSISRTAAAGIVGFGLLGAVAGGPLSGFAAKKVEEYRKPYIAVHAMVVVMWLLLALTGASLPLWGAYVLFFLLGFGNGGSMLTFASIRETFPVNQVGVVSGLANTGGFLSAVLIPPLMGIVLDHLGMHAASSYRLAFVIPCLFSVVGCIGSILLPVQRRVK